MKDLDFLRKDLIEKLKTLSAETKGQWGVMNAQQMVEHMTDSVRIANGKVQQNLHTPADQVGKWKEFAMSDKEFRPNTKNALLGDEPQPLVNKDMPTAIEELKMEVEDFVKHFEGKAGKTQMNALFGDLNYEEWQKLLSKHGRHHLRQFGLTE